MSFLHFRAKKLIEEKKRDRQEKEKEVKSILRSSILTTDK